MLDSPNTSRDKSPPWNGLAWLARVGWSVDANTKQDTNSLTLPMTGGEINPFSADAAASLLSRFRERGWLPASNRSNPAANTFASANGQLTIDAPVDILTLDTPRTAGGFAPAGRKIETGAASIEIMDTDATVWVSSLDQNAIPVSSRLLITHLTDLQNTGTRYAGLDRKVLLDWGRLPHLVQAGRARIILRLESPSAARVYGLTTDGRRTAEIPATASNEAGTLTIPLAVDADGKARMLYEVEVKN